MSAPDSRSAPQAAGQAAADAIPDVFVRWLSTSYATGHVPTAHDITSEWNRAASARRKFWRAQAAIAAAAPAPAGEGWDISALLERISVLSGALYEIKTAYPAGYSAHDTASDALRLSAEIEREAKPQPSVGALLADRNQLREALRRIALGSAGDPSVDILEES